MNEADGESDGLRVLALERVEEVLIPAIDSERGAEIGEEEKENGTRQNPRPPPRVTAPEAEGEAQKTLSDAVDCTRYPSKRRKGGCAH